MARPDIAFSSVARGDRPGHTFLTAEVSDSFVINVMREQFLAEVASGFAKKYVEENYEQMKDIVNKAVLYGLVHQHVSEQLGKDAVQKAYQLQQGVCPDCGENPRRNLKHPACFGPEWAEGMRERNLNIATGHKNSCVLAHQ